MICIYSGNTRGSSIVRSASVFSVNTWNHRCNDFCMCRNNLHTILICFIWNLAHELNVRITFSTLSRPIVWMILNIPVEKINYAIFADDHITFMNGIFLSNLEIR